MRDDITQLGAVAVIFLFAVREFFSYLRTRNTNGSAGFNKEIFEELRTMNNNHLHSIQQTIEGGNFRLVETIHNDNKQMIEILGEIKGKISR